MKKEKEREKERERERERDRERQRERPSGNERQRVQATKPWFSPLEHIIYIQVILLQSSEPLFRPPVV